MKAPFEACDVLFLRTALPVLLLAVLGASPGAVRAAEPSPGPDRTFGDETTVTLVEVPVRVLDGGKPVTGLGPDDFRIFDEGEERPVFSVERVDLRESTGAGAPLDLSPAARRHFLLLFDLAFTDGPYLLRAVEAGRNLIEEGLHPTDLVAVAFFNMRTGLSEVVGFTPDHAQALEALDQLAAFLGSDRDRVASAGGEAGGARSPDPLRLQVGEWSAQLRDVGSAREATRSLGYEGMKVAANTGGRGLGALPDMMIIGEADMKQIRATEASALITSLGDLAESMRWVDGAKYLLLFSRGFESRTFQEDTGSWVLDELNRTVEKFRRAGWSIHSIETTGQLNTGNRQQRREALFFLANETGGVLMENELDLSRAMGRILEQTSVTYVLTFESPPPAQGGAFRRLRVELAPGSAVPDGARVFHRAGYFTPEPFGEMGREERRAATAELVLSGQAVDDIASRELISPEAALSDDRMRVSVLFDVDARSLLESRNWQATRVEVLAYAFHDSGRVAASWGREFFLTPDVVVKVTRAGSLLFQGDLEVAPGNYEVRSVVRNVDDGRVALHTYRLRVPDLSGGAVTLLAPIFADLVDKDEEGTARRLLIRDVTHGTDYPFSFGERRFLPALAPAVAPGVESMLIGRGIWEQPPDRLRVVVFDANGFPVPGGVSVRLLGSAGDQDQAIHQLAFGVRPTGLPPGDYELRLLSQGPDGATVSSPPAGFRVTSGSWASP